MAKKKLFKLASGKGGRSPRLGRSVRAEKIPNPGDEAPYFVRDQEADSKDEYWVGLALERIEEDTGITWEYQVPVYGGRNLPHGNVVDFLVHTPGMWTILDPMGEYWHTGKKEDRRQMVDVARKKKWRLVAWFTKETPSREAVYSYLRKELHV